MKLPIETSSILALARAGAIGRAWSMFNDAGLGSRDNDPSVLTLKGRLLKDLARTADDAATRGQLFQESASAYIAAARVAPSSYPLINAATMSLFAGNEVQARSLAGEVETMIANGLDRGETPYWHEATRAEALLLLGQRDDARTALEAAIGHAPQAWEDLATTLRQFRMIDEFRNDDPRWLKPYAPPVSLSYSGLIAISENDQSAAEKIADAIEWIRPGFAYGAIAAGADILIAEACLARGCELHVILPADIETFRRLSVAPYGENWTTRFNHLLAEATSIHVLAPHQHLSKAAIALAADVSAGSALHNAQRLESVAKAMQVVAPDHVPLKENAETVLVSVARSETAEAGVDLADMEVRYWLAVDHDDGTVPVVENLTDIDQAMARAAEYSQCSVALDIGIVEIGGDDDDRRARVARVAQAGTAGTVVAGHDAAMRWIHSQPAGRVEPLGEMPSNDGAISLYSIHYPGQST